MLRVYPPPNFWVLHIDGSARPNPGRMAMGVVLTGPDGSTRHCTQRLPGIGCNNEAELRALHEGLRMAQSQGARSLRIYTDSQWLVGQLSTSTSISTPATPSRAPRMRPTARLAPWVQPVMAQLQDFAQVQWRWVPRHHNTEADALARQASLAA